MVSTNQCANPLGYGIYCSRRCLPTTDWCPHMRPIRASPGTRQPPTPPHPSAPNPPCAPGGHHTPVRLVRPPGCNCSGTVDIPAAVSAFSAKGACCSPPVRVGYGNQYQPSMHWPFSKRLPAHGRQSSTERRARLRAHLKGHPDRLSLRRVHEPWTAHTPSPPRPSYQPPNTRTMCEVQSAVSCVRREAAGGGEALRGGF